MLERMKSLFDRIFGRRPVEVPLTPALGEDEKIGWLRDSIRRDVAIGFDDEDVILQNAAVNYEDEIEQPRLRNAAQRLLREALAEQAEAELHWPERTDCDRLDDAFDALEADGVIARQHFSCCGTCGSSEIWDEVNAAEEAGRPARGYAFYHVQDLSLIHI